MDKTSITSSTEIRSPLDDLSEFAVRMAADKSGAGELLETLPKSEVVHLGTQVVTDSDAIEDKKSGGELTAEAGGNTSEGVKLGDMLYWYEDEDGSNGEWVILSAPITATVLQVLSFDPLAANRADRIPKWIDTEECP